MKVKCINTSVIRKGAYNYTGGKDLVLGQVYEISNWKEIVNGQVCYNMGSTLGHRMVERFIEVEDIKVITTSH